MNCLTHKYTHVHMGSAKGLFKITPGSQSLPSRVINRLLPRQHSNVALNITAQLIFYVIELHLTTFRCTHRAHMCKHTWATPTHINRPQKPLQKNNNKWVEKWSNERKEMFAGGLPLRKLSVITQPQNSIHLWLQAVWCRCVSLFE